MDTITLNELCAAAWPVIGPVLCWGILSATALMFWAFIMKGAEG